MSVLVKSAKGPREIALAYRRFKIVRDYDADGVVVCELERAADTIDRLRAENDRLIAGGIMVAESGGVLRRALEAERDAALADVKSTKTILDAKTWYIQNSRYREDGTRCECCTEAHKISAERDELLRMAEALLDSTAAKDDHMSKCEIVRDPELMMLWPEHKIICTCGCVANHTDGTEFLESLDNFWGELFDEREEDGDLTSIVFRHENIMIFSEAEQSGAAEAHQISYVENGYKCQIFERLPFAWNQS